MTTHLEINCLIQLIKLFLFGFFLSCSQSKANYKWTSNAFYFFPDTSYKSNKQLYRLKPWVSAFDLLRTVCYVNVALSIQPVPRRDPGININFYFPKEGPNFESKTFSYNILGCRLLKGKSAWRWFLSQNAPIISCLTTPSKQL